MSRDIQRLKIYVVVLAVALVAVFIAFLKLSRFGQAELSLERLNIVDAKGVPRLVLSNQEHMPPPIIAGKVLKRAISPAGVVFYDARGDEVGGIALSETPGGKLSAMVFDYPNADAIALLRSVSADGKEIRAGLQINNAPPVDANLKDAGKLSERRIAVQNNNNDAEILLADPAGHDRIRLRVDRHGEAKIEILDASGNVTFTAPQSNASHQPVEQRSRADSGLPATGR